MTTTLSTTTTNPHIAALESVFGDSPSSIEWLVIAHNDSQMLQSLSSGLTGQAAAILQVSQDTWDFQGKHLPESIEWALQQGEIKKLVLVGNSQPAGSGSQASLASANAASEGESSSAKLLAGIQQHNTRNRDSLQRFATHFQQLLQIPVLHNRWSSGELAVYGLYYRAESGLFLAYDAEADTFHPLVM